MQNPTGFSFGTPSSQPTQTSLFGAGNTPTTGLFQTPASTSTPLFGAATTANATFGTNTTPAFGATPISTPSFGATAAAPSFGATATPTFGAAVTTSTFGATPTTTPAFGVANPVSTNTATSLNFGTLTSTAAPAFGSTSAAPTLFGSTSTAPATGFGTGLSFGTTTSGATTGFGFGTTTTASSTAIVTPSFNLGATSTPSTTASQGLGGQPSTQAKVVTTQKDVTPKDQPLPNEILQTVEAFKELVKQQKLHSSDIARCSVRDFRKVEQDINNMAQLLCEVESQLQKNRQLAEKLKYDTAKCLKDVEIAQRTQDTPPGLQYENTAPLKFFLNLADKFETEMQALKVQIEGADNYVKNYRSPSALTPQDLHLGMRRLYESFVALAGRLYSVHNQVESQKEAYLQIRKQMYNDYSNPFENICKPVDQTFQNTIFVPPKVATGPTPFNNFTLGLTQPLGTQQNQSSMPYTTPTTSATGFGNIGFGTSLGGQPTAGTQNSLFGGSSVLQNNSFQLQKPPTGNKRGKQ